MSDRRRAEESDELIANRYRIKKRISRSEKASILLVIDTKINDEIKCLKTMRFRIPNTADTKELIREENFLSKLDHPYILKYNESFIHSGCLFIVTEYCEGGDLSHFLKKLQKDEERLPEEKIMFWFSQLVSACYYIHSRKILHRNIKPNNIFLKDGNVKLGDFGISRQLTGEEKDTDTFIGAPYYMSPELVQNERYNSKTDIWSLGCVLYELSTFQKPFVGDRVCDIFKSIVHDETPSIQNLYSKDLNKLLKMTLRKEPTERPSAEELLNEEYLQDFVKSTIRKSLDNARSSTAIASLVNATSFFSQLLEDSFGEFDEKSTLRSTPKTSSLRSFKDSN